MDMESKIKKLSYGNFFCLRFISQCIHVWRRLCDRESDRKKFVDEYHWIDENEMLDLVAIAQSAPGAVAVNGAIAVGYKLAGLLPAW